MENVEEYIESGILELYAMGDLSPAEKLEVELMAAKHTAIKTELIEIEKAIESYANQLAIDPNESLRDKVISKLPGNESNLASDLKLDPKIVSIHNNQTNNFYKYAFAASVAILLISWVALFSVYNKLETSNNQIADLQLSNQKFSNRVNYYNKELSETQTSLNVLRNPDFKLIKLAPTKIAPPSASMMVAFNARKKEVMIDMSAMKMPSNDDEHQYQLWAMVNGKPVDLGVFDMKSDSTGMVKMKEITNAQAFAVTLEPRGGSINPTMNQLMVMGAI